VGIYDGTAALGAVLTSDANGLAHWDTTTANPRIGFSASNSTMANNSPYIFTGYNVIFNTVDFNDGSGYNSSTGIFTAPQSGMYHFDGHMMIRTSISSTSQLSLNLNGSAQRQVRMVTDASERSLVLSADIKLSAGDQVNLNYYFQSSSGTITPVQSYCYFAGYKVY
jgi:hypothetical protein